MAIDTLTLAFTGDVPFDAFTTALSHWLRLVNALEQDMQVRGHIAWFIQDLSAGSAMATIRGEAEVIEDVEQVVRAYGETGNALQQGTPIPYSDLVIESARGITRVLDGHIRAVRFETPEREAVIASPAAPLAIKVTPTVVGIGAVQGRIQTLTERRALRFTLFDSLNDRGVSCYLAEAQRELGRGLWGKQVAVLGTVTRDTETGRPLVVRHITSIQIAEATGRSYLNARGALPITPGTPYPEQIIRNIRDA